MKKTKSKTKDKKQEAPEENEALKNIRWEAFCHYYLFGGEYEKFEIGKKGKAKKKKKTIRFRMGNGTMSYCMAYQLDPNNASNYGTARANSAVILANTSIKKRMKEILEQEGFNDLVVDARHMEIIIHGRNQDSNVAIKEYNNLKKRIDSNPQNNIIVIDDQKRMKMNKALEYLISKKK